MARLQVSQYALLASVCTYLAVFYAITPRKASPLRLAASREAISIIHCTTMAILTIICLQRELPATIAQTREVQSGAGPTADRHLPIITTRSEFANALTAIETAYLLQDSPILLLAAQSQQVFLHKRTTTTSGPASTKNLRGLNLRHLGWHHALLGSAFVVLQVYIARGKEKGILIIVAMLLMNASSPFGTARWFLINFRPEAKRLIKGLTVAYLIAFAACRVGLLYSILHIFGKQLDISALEAFRRLRVPCKLAMSSLGLVNTAWFLNALRSFILREMSTRKKLD
jgi:hypothetical protein